MSEHRVQYITDDNTSRLSLRTHVTTPPRPLDPRWVVALEAAQRACEIFAGGFKLLAEAIKRVREMG